MALAGKQTTGLIARQLQEGINKVLDESLAHAYYGKYKELFPTVKHDKIIYEILKLAGSGVAGLKGEGEPITSFDSIDQHWTFTPRLLTYEKSARLTVESEHYNLYMPLIPRIGKELAKAHEIRKDVECAGVFNDAFDATVSYGDGKALCAADHPVQASSSDLSNVVTADFDEDALEQMRIQIYGFVNDDGQLGDYEPRKLVYPTQLMHEVDRVLNTQLRPATANNDANVNRDMGDISEKCLWKRLTDTDAFFVMTNHDDGFCLAESMPVTMKRFAENNSWDSVVSTIAMWVPIVKDPARAVIGSAGL